ncbi:MAG: transposase [Methanoregula sp.]|nr:transposase [Methanoregula sp.]
MEIIVQMQVKVCLPEDEAVPIENLVYMLRNQHIEARLLEKIINSADTDIATKLCGEKYTKKSGNERYLRSGTSEKKLITSVGQLNIKVNRVKDIYHNRIIKPVLEMIRFAGRQKFQPDLVMICVDFAQKLSYRDTVEELTLVVPVVPSRMTINKQVMELGESIEINPENACMPVAMIDGTKSHSQEPGVKQNDINVIIGVQDGRKVLLGITVNQSWKALADHLDTNEIFSEIAVIVSDGEPELRAAFANENIQFQMDLIHGFRILGYKLWKDGALDLKQREEIINELKGLLLSLKNVVVFHKSEPDRIGEKINQIIDGMESLANRLKDMGCPGSAAFLNTYSNTLVTFARLSINGIDIPWNSNMIERLMGEISKRVKHKWMRWTTRGLEAILKLILIRYTSPWQYRAFRNENMGHHYVSKMTVQFSMGTEKI